METEHFIEQTIAWVRSSTKAELRAQPERLMTIGEVTNIVDQALQEVFEALKDAIDSGYLDEQQGDWWNGYGTPGHESFQGGITPDYPLPRVRKDDPQ